MAGLEQIDFAEKIRRANQLWLIVPCQIAEIEKIEFAELQNETDALVVIGIDVVGMRFVIAARGIFRASAGNGFVIA